MYPNPAKCFFFPHQRLQVPKPKNEICFLQEEIHVSVPPLVKLVPTKVCIHFSVQVLEKKKKITHFASHEGLSHSFIYAVISLWKFLILQVHPEFKWLLCL